jgi:hypothetical protein
MDKRNSAKDQYMRRTGPMNSDNIATNNDKIMHEHVLEIGLDEGRLLVQGFDEMITEGDKS